jgi:hypothetical protein
LIPDYGVWGNGIGLENFGIDWYPIPEPISKLSVLQWQIKNQICFLSKGHTSKRGNQRKCSAFSPFFEKFPLLYEEKRLKLVA